MLIRITEEKVWNVPTELKEEYLEYLGENTPNLTNFEEFLDDNLYWDEIVDADTVQFSTEIDNDSFQEFLNND